MPLVRIEILKGKDKSYKKKLLDCVHSSLVTALGIDDSDRFQRLFELENDCFERCGKTDNFTMIEITMFPGRTAQQKAAVIEEIAKSLGSSLSIRPEDIFIVMNEPPDENWGFAGKQRKSSH